MMKAVLLALCVAYVWAEETKDTNEHVKRQLFYPGYAGGLGYGGGFGYGAGFYGHPGVLYGRKRREAETEEEPTKMDKRYLGGFYGAGYPGFGYAPAYGGFGYPAYGGAAILGRKRRETDQTRPNFGNNVLMGRKRREAETETETEQFPKSLNKRYLGGFYGAGYPGFGYAPAYGGFGYPAYGGAAILGRKRREAETEEEPTKMDKRYLGGFYGAGYPGFGYAPAYGGFGYPAYGGAAILGRKRREAAAEETAEKTETQDKRSLFGGFGGFGGYGGYRPEFGYGYGGYRPGFGGYSSNFFPGYGFGGYSDYPSWGSGHYYSRWRREAAEEEEGKDKRHILLGGYPGYAGGFYPGGYGYGGFGYGYGAPVLG